MSVEDVLSVVIRDKVYYEESGGGMTLSGGEPLAQYEFTRSLLHAAREQHIHTCLETCGYATTADMTTLASLTNIVLFDIKETDPERHRTFTGVPNAIILENLRKLDTAGAAIILRCILIPGINYREDHIQALATLALSLRGIQGIDLLGYHPFGSSKQQRFGNRDDCHPELTQITPHALERAAERLRGLGCEGVRVL